ncbi:hypothetical protein [Herbaspirillum sp. YR522]|uniref:hypothetical protein n=1 Tax=Herbaspirillum sp. YR522 TaxID=1144342 RepID=UPI00026F99A0|nr:hypothetical protein [Herbaspirillum sp. YR522]EJN07940.1 hypothetical protein PMI40_01568 [Herbaspirillum sp. YR522]
METPESSQSPQTAAPVDPWTARADELRGTMEALLEVQLHEYEVMNAKLEAWKQDPSAGHLTVNDYEPWQLALKKLEQAHREFDAHLATRVGDAPPEAR